jgi:tubulin---tyrosine ligase
MADRGMGIRLFNSKDTLQSIFESFEDSEDEEEEDNGPEETKSTDGPDTAVITSQLRHFVIQVSLYS